MINISTANALLVILLLSEIKSENLSSEINIKHFYFISSLISYLIFYFISFDNSYN